MKTTRILLPSLAIVGLLVAPTAFAAITGVSFPNPHPGGTGADGGTGTSFTEPQFTFTSLDYIDMTITVDSGGTYNISEAPLFGYARNNTGQTWTAFDITLLPGGVGSLVNDWADYPTNHPSNYTATDIYFPSESIADGTSFAFTGDVTASGPGSFTLRETPVAAPEPTSTALAGISALGFLMRRRRR